MQGLLSGKYLINGKNDVPVYRARTRHFNGNREKSRHGEKGHEKLLIKTLDNLREISNEYNIPLADLAISWPINNSKYITSVIVGVTKSSQLLLNINASKIKLSDEIINKLNNVTDELKQAMGNNCDLWQGLHNDGKFDGRIK